jgi:glycosyltransferase involved in cell wall biosynthesis
MPTIACVIPLYNGAQYIKQAIDSVFAQDRAVDDIIIVDDGSTDNGAQIVEAMLHLDSRLRILRKPNGGQGSARNMGIANTNCDLIAFLDQDDYWYSHHLSTLEKLFIENDDGRLAYVYSNPDRVADNGDMIAPRCINRLKHQQHPKRSLMDCLERDMMILPSSSLVSREAFLEVGGFDERFKGYEDDDLFIRMFLAGYRSEYLNEALYAWRDNPSSTSYSRKMMVSRELYFDKISDSILVGVPKSERAIVAHRFARSASGDIKSAIKRNDKDTLDFAFRQSMKFSREMRLPIRLLLRFKVLRRYLAFYASDYLEQGTSRKNNRLNHPC